jgi:restriction system protein
MTIIYIAAAIIIVYRRKVARRQLLLKSGIDIVDKMTGEEFEVFLLAHFINMGYKGNTTSKSHDYGADLVLKKDNKTIVVQAKRWGKKVGIEAVQQIIGAKKYYKANSSMVITSSYFTSSAVNLAKSDDVELWDRDVLIKVMEKVNGKQLAENNLDTDKISKRKVCKKCGADMVLRNGSKGSFFGCSKFPKCHYTEDI